MTDVTMRMPGEPQEKPVALAPSFKPETGTAPVAASSPVAGQDLTRVLTTPVANPSIC